jgi:ParB family chromosome partitioning protein
MKRAIPRSVLEQMKAKRADPESENTQPEAGQGSAHRESIPGGFGGAWKAGAMAQVEGDLTDLRGDMVAAVMAGKRELSLDPALIDDPLGSDRRPDWQDSGAFTALKESIAANGQDVPVQVWPADPAWRPDPRDPLDTGAQRFHLLSGRRRRAACADLGMPLRAVIVPPPEGASEAENRFAMLFHRFRENEAREDLSPFERLLSVGEIYEALAQSEATPLTAVAFAARIGVHESIVSRARAVLRHREAILNTFKTPYDLSFRALQDALSDIEGQGKKPSAKKKPKAKPYKAEISQGGRTLKAVMSDKTVTIRLSHADADADDLQKALAKFAAALPNRNARKKGD